MTLPLVLIDETKYRDESYLYQAVCKTQLALKNMTKANKHFIMLKEFLEQSKTACGGCGAHGKKESSQLENLISKPELNGKICKKVKT